jgi:ATP-dependent Clp protease, protease subunit
MACRASCVENAGKSKRRPLLWLFTNPIVGALSAVIVIAAGILLAEYVLQIGRQVAMPEEGDGLETKIEKGIYNSPLSDTLLFKQRKIYFSNDINELTCSWLAKQLLLLGGAGNAKDIDLYLCSSGGNIADAKAICNVMHDLGAKVNIYASGFCASSGVRVLAAATGRRIAYGNTVFMFHGQDLRYANREHSYDAVARELDIEEWRSMTDIPQSMILDTTEFYFTPREALKYGIVDTVIPIPAKDSAGD